MGWTRWVALSLAVFINFGCSKDPNLPPKPSVTLRPCRLPGLDTELRCTDIAVPERRQPETAPTAGPPRSIYIHVAILAATARAHRVDPIFVLAGGPGQAATAIAGTVFPLFAQLNRDRDIVFMDQRGTGRSNPLACTPPAEGGLGAALDLATLVHSVGLCAAKLRAAGNDLTQYLTTDAVKDIDDVRSRLGYTRINLWGASYGTRVALEYLRQYPEHVRTAILDGPAPAGLNLPISYAIDADEALTRLISDCEKNSECATTHPELEQQIDALFERLHDGSISTTLTQPLTGRPLPITVTRDVFAAWLRAPLYTSVTSSLLPVAIAQAALGNFNALAALNFAVSEGASEDISLGMHLSVMCGEDMRNISPADLERVDQTRFGRVFYEQYLQLCAVWPTRPAPASFYAPIVASVPVLILAGGLDPITPPRRGAPLLAGFAQAKELIAPHVAHGVSMQGCAPDLIEKFVQSANPARIDGSCLAKIPRPPFFEAIMAENR